ncbi:hypothetical protein BH09ACT7_BH09ACT7_30510 [soil metagenome]
MISAVVPIIVAVVLAVIPVLLAVGVAAAAKKKK